MRVCGETHGSCGCVATVVSEDLSDYTQGKGAAEQFAQELHCKSMQLCPNEGSFAPKRRQQLCRVFVQLPDCNLYGSHTPLRLTHDPGHEAPETSEQATVVFGIVMLQ